MYKMTACDKRKENRKYSRKKSVYVTTLSLESFMGL